MRGWRSLGNDASLHNKGSLFTLMLGPPGTLPYEAHVPLNVRIVYICSQEWQKLKNVFLY